MSDWHGPVPLTAYKGLTRQHAHHPEGHFMWTKYSGGGLRHYVSTKGMGAHQDWSHCREQEVNFPSGFSLFLLESCRLFLGTFPSCLQLTRIEHAAEYYRKRQVHILGEVVKNNRWPMCLQKVLSHVFQSCVAETKQSLFQPRHTLEWCNGKRDTGMDMFLDQPH